MLGQKLYIGGIQLSIIELAIRRGAGLIKMWTYASRRKEVVSMRTFTNIFLMQCLVHKLLAFITFFVSFIQTSIFLCLFVFLFIKLERWLPSKNKAAFTRINIWIYIKISTPIFVTAQIPSFSKVSLYPTKYYFPISAISSYNHGILKSSKLG